MGGGLKNSTPYLDRAGLEKFSGGDIWEDFPMGSKPRRRPAMDLEGREDQMINLAMNLAEKKLRDGTASNQLIIEFIRRGSTKDELEKEKLRKENNLLEVKTSAIQAQKNEGEMFERAINAMRLYSGGDPVDDEIPNI